MKTCTKCHQDKMLSAFAKNGAKQLYRPECKVCRAEILRLKRNPAGMGVRLAPIYWRSNDGVVRSTAELKKLRDQRYTSSHAAAIRERGAQYREANREAIKKSHLAYARLNPDRMRLHKNRRRALNASAVGHCTLTQLKARFEFYGNKCAYCRTGEAEAGDHVVPLSRGGSNFPANIRPSCKTCNSSKHAKKFGEWSRSKQSSLTAAS